MHHPPLDMRISPLRQRLIEDMTMRRFSPETQRNYLRDVGRFATWLGRSPHTATAEDVRRFQIEQRDAGIPAPTMNSIVAALRFFFNHTLDRPDLGMGYSRVFSPHHRPYPTQDGHICVMAAMDNQWLRLFDAIGRPELRDDAGKKRRHLVEIGIVRRVAVDPLEPDAAEEFVHPGPHGLVVDEAHIGQHMREAGLARIPFRRHRAGIERSIRGFITGHSCPRHGWTCCAWAVSPAATS